MTKEEQSLFDGRAERLDEYRTRIAYLERELAACTASHQKQNAYCARLEEELEIVAEPYDEIAKQCGWPGPHAARIGAGYIQRRIAELESHLSALLLAGEPLAALIGPDMDGLYDERLRRDHPEVAVRIRALAAALEKAREAKCH